MGLEQVQAAFARLREYVGGRGIEEALADLDVIESYINEKTTQEQKA